MKYIKGLAVLLAVFSSQLAYADWHKIGVIKQVTVLENRIFVKGESTSGPNCTDYAGFYGTLYSHKDDSAFDEYYSMALAGYLSQKSLACYIYENTEESLCKMKNCHLY